MEDVAPKLYEDVQKTFNEKLQKDPYIVSYLSKLKKGNVDFTDTQLYSKRLGTLLGDTFKDVLTEEALPNGQLYWNIAERVISPMLSNNYDLVNIAASATQNIIDVKEGIGLKPVQAKLPNERIKGVLDNATVKDLEIEEVQNRLKDPIVNITESYFDDFIKTNADFRYKAGFKPQIIRIIKGNKPCKWCKSLAGVYDYGDIGKNSDVFRRHQNCHCQVIYRTDKYKQDVWSKKITTVEKSPKESTMKMVDKTSHALERMAQRDVNDLDINDALNKPLYISDIKIDESGRKSVKYIGESVTVVINPDNKSVITTWKTGTKTRAKYRKDD